MRQQLCLSFKVASMFSHHANTLIMWQETERHRCSPGPGYIKGWVSLVRLEPASLIFLVTKFFCLFWICALSSENLWRVALVCSWMADLVGRLSICVSSENLWPVALVCSWMAELVGCLLSVYPVRTCGAWPWCVLEWLSWWDGLPSVYPY